MTDPTCVNSEYENLTRINGFLVRWRNVEAECRLTLKLESAGLNQLPDI